MILALELEHVHNVRQHRAAHCPVRGHHGAQGKNVGYKHCPAAQRLAQGERRYLRDIVRSSKGNDSQRDQCQQYPGDQHADGDRSTSIGRNDSIEVEHNQLIMIGDNKDERIIHRMQTFAEIIRIEAGRKLLEYSTTHNIKASQNIAIDGGTLAEIKAMQVKTN